MPERWEHNEIGVGTVPEGVTVRFDNNHAAYSATLTSREANILADKLIEAIDSRAEDTERGPVDREARLLEALDIIAEAYPYLPKPIRERCNRKGLLKIEPPEIEGDDGI